MFSPAQVKDVKCGQEHIKDGNKFLPLDDALGQLRTPHKYQRSYACPGRGSIWKRMLGTTQWMLEALQPEEPEISYISCRSHSIIKWTEEMLELVKDEFRDLSFILDCGAGAFGRVWLVEDISEQIVALKVIPKQCGYEIELDSLKLYRKYIKDFSHLVQIYHVGETEHFFYYTMEAAYSFSEKEYKPLTLDKTLLGYAAKVETQMVVKSILCGANILHGNELAHRDIKPQNVIFVDGVPKLADIGLISKITDNSFKGTMEFIPPDMRVEQSEVYTSKLTGIDCDLYAVGKITYLLLSGEALDSFPELSTSILKTREGKKLNAIIQKACSNTVEERYRTASDFLNDLIPQSLFGRIFGRK